MSASPVHPRAPGSPLPGGYGVYLLYAEALLREDGAADAADRLAEMLGDPALLERVRRLPAGRLMQVLTPIARDADRGGFFLRLGSRVPITAHGAIGLAMQASRDLAAALEVVEAYAPLLVPYSRIRLDRSGDQAEVVIATDSGNAAFDQIIVESIAAALATQLPAVAGRGSRPLAAHFRHAAPPWAAQYPTIFGPRLRFGAAANQLLWPQGLFDVPLPSADPIGLRLRLPQCAAELAQAVIRQRWRDRVQGVLLSDLVTAPSLAAIAARLQVSERSLRRHLAAEGAPFRMLLADLRLSEAQRLLADTALPVAGIASRLGYADPACFRRLFRQATGSSPRGWRTAQRGG